MNIKARLRDLKKAGRAKQRRTAPRKTTPQKTSSLTAADRQMFASFKIPNSLVEKAGVYRVDDAQARALHIRGRNLAGIAFPSRLRV